MKPGDMTTEEQCQMVAEASAWMGRALKAEAALATLTIAPDLREQIRGYVWNCRDGAIEVEDALNFIMAAVLPMDTRLFDLLEGVKYRLRDNGEENRAMNLAANFARGSNGAHLLSLIDILAPMPTALTSLRDLEAARNDAAVFAARFNELRSKAGDGGSGF